MFKYRWNDLPYILFIGYMIMHSTTAMVHIIYVLFTGKTRVQYILWITFGEET